jgi:DNA repair exonuclease SbcCD nuclease subunit
VRLLHTADWQLGMTRHFLDADAQPRYTDARIQAVRRIAELAVSERCDAVLVCGDVFESNLVGPRVVGRSLEALREVPVPVYLLPGNHDPLDAASIYRSRAFRTARPDHVHVLDGAGAHAVAEGVEIVAAPWTSKRPLSDLVGDVISGLPADGTVRVVAGHGCVDVLGPDPGDPALVRLAAIEAALARGAAHYVALGDRHSRTSVGTSGAVWYSGTPEVTDYDEVDPGQVLVVDIEHGRPVEVTSHRVGTWSFLDLHRRLDGPDDLDALEQALSTLPGKDRTVLRLALTGTLSLADRSRLDALLERQGRLFASLRLWDRHTDLAVFVSGDELTDLGVGGFADGAVDELAALAKGGGEEAATAQEALGLLYRLAGGRG